MSDLLGSPTPVRTALFVDFDNIYLGLQNEDPQAAEQFATHPGRWLRWLAENLPFDSYGDEAEKARRRILFRRCYLNPSQFSRFRPYFIRSAFEVVDCPPLTRGGKTSADIQMVMDIMDALGHATRFEEFILLSGDADFTPLLLRLSKHDRRSVVLAAGPASAAYKAACDLVIDQDVFLEEAIGVVSEGGVAARSVENQELLTRIAEKIHERASLTGELVATDLPAIFREFPEFTPDSNWLGFYSLRGMASAVIRTRRDLAMVEGDPWRVRLRGEGEILPPVVEGPPNVLVAPIHRSVTPLPSFTPNPQVDPVLLTRIAERIHDRMMFSGVLLATDLPAIFREFPEFTPNSNWLGFYSLRAMTAGVLRTRRDLQIVEGDPWRIERRPEPPEPGGDEPPPADHETLTGQIVEYVRSVIESSETAVPMARAAQTVISRFGSDVLSSGWAGAGSFRDLLEAQENPGFVISSVKPGYLYNPKRHSVPSPEDGDQPDIGGPELSSLAHRIHRLTDAPFMTPAEYALVFSKIAEEVNENQYFLTRTSKNVRDRCIDVDEPIARASVNFVLRGITFAGHRFEEGVEQQPLVLGEAFVKNLIGLCESAGLSLGEEEKALLGEWILSALPAGESTESSDPETGSGADGAAEVEEAPAEVESRPV